MISRTRAALCAAAALCLLQSAAGPIPARSRARTSSLPTAAVLAASTGYAAAPAVTPGAVVNAASYAPIVAASTWVSVFGGNLSPSTRSWQAADFSGDRLPTVLDGVAVRINGKSGGIAYISPTQINVLTPDDDAEGSVQLEISTPQGTSAPVPVLKQRISPGLFAIDAGGHRYAAAVHADGTAVANSGALPGLAARPAAPGDTVMVFGNGFGPTSPPHSASQLVRSPAPLSAPVSARIGGIPAAISWAGLVMAGVYQFNIVVPATPDGDQPLLIETGGSQSQADVLIPVRGNSTPTNRPILVNHTTTDFTRIPDQWIEKARQGTRLYYGHTSHGAQVTTGMKRLKAQYGDIYNVAIDSTLPPQSDAVRIQDASTYDWDPDFYATVVPTLKATPEINIVMYVWCGQAAGANAQALFEQYIAGMQSLERQYPKVTFVYSTGNAQEQDCPGCLRHQFNQRLRDFATKNGKVLFDFGDLDAWANGTQQTYTAPYWCAQYGCAAGAVIPSEHTAWGGGDYNNPCGHANYASCDNKAKAMWWLLARIAGWDGTPSGSAAARRVNDGDPGWYGPGWIAGFDWSGMAPASLRPPRVCLPTRAALK